MRTALWLGEHNFEIQESPLPEPGAGEVRVKVHGCGICGTDLHGVQGLLGMYQPPRVLGHEYAGVIDAVGIGVSHLAVGDPVVCLPSPACGICANCLAGRPPYECLQPKSAPGFAEYAVVSVSKVIPLPAGADLAVASLLEPLSCCVRAVDLANIRSGEKVAIVGAGPLGQMVLQLAKRSGASAVLVSEINPVRREMASRLGADLTIDPSKESLVNSVADFTGGRGIDVAFEVAAVPAALNDCVKSVRHGGKVIMVGVHAASARLELELLPFHRREVSLISSWGGAGAFQRTATWLNHLELRPLLTHFFDLADIGRAFDTAKSGAAVKVLVGAGLS